MSLAAVPVHSRTIPHLGDAECRLTRGVLAAAGHTRLPASPPECGPTRTILRADGTNACLPSHFPSRACWQLLGCTFPVPPAAIGPPRARLATPNSCARTISALERLQRRLTCVCLTDYLHVTLPRKRADHTQTNHEVIVHDKNPHPVSSREFSAHSDWERPGAIRAC